MAKFKGAILSCQICGSEFKVPPVRAATAKFCSKDCADKGRGEAIKRRVTLECAECGKSFEMPRCHKDRRKYCSYECKHSSLEYAKTMSALTAGEQNGHWKGGVVPHSDGYLYTRCSAHPFASNGYVFSHRLVMEEWLRRNKPRSRFLIRLGEQWYLSPLIHVHHRDQNKQNNDICNLQCVTPSEHQRIHADLRRGRKRQPTG